MTSSPLFISVAQSTVIFGPIFQFGCFSASSFVFPASASRVMPKNGPPEQVTAIIHRQSVIHSLVEFVDGAVMAQLGVPDMRIPIGLAMTYPARLHNPAPALDLLACGNLNFAEIDEAAFPCFALAKQAARIGGTACAAMNAANEAAVARYLRDEIGFYDIPAAVERALTLPVMQNPTLDDILAIDAEARRIAAAL